MPGPGTLWKIVKRVRIVLGQWLWTATGVGYAMLFDAVNEGAMEKVWFEFVE